MERVEIVYRPYDIYTKIAEDIVGEFDDYLRQENAIKGELGYIEELQMIIAENLRRRSNVTEEAISEKTDGK